ncbi:MAG TPA: hypothetical protein VIW24_04885 [Aldersonia sp.]
MDFGRESVRRANESERELFPWQLQPMIRRILWLALVVLAIGLGLVIGVFQ